MPLKTEEESISYPVLSDADVYEAMKTVSGYLDITPEDFRGLYRLAYRHAMERIWRSTTATEFMTRDVISVSRPTPLVEVAAIMARHRVSGVPVVGSDGSVVGMISEKDFLMHMGVGRNATFMDIVAAYLESQKCPAVSIHGRNAEDIMSTPVISVSEDASLLDVARTLTENGINRVPVLDSDKRLSGIITRADLVKAVKAERIP